MWNQNKTQEQFTEEIKSLQSRIAELEKAISALKNTEFDLRDSLQKYETLFENINIGIYRNTGGPEGHFLQANPGIVKIFGYSSVNEFLQVNVSSLYQNPEDRRFFMEEILRKGEVRNKELALKRKDGTPIWCSVTAKAFRDNYGNIKWFDGVIEDITERKKVDERLRLANEEWSRTFDAVSDPIFIQDKENTILRVNKAFVQMMKLDAQTLIGNKCYKILHGMEEPWPECPLEKTKLDQKSHTEEVDDPHLGVALLVTTSPVFNEKKELIGAVHIARDISERKAIERELQKKVDYLERFQKVTVDRELKMKELKAKIKELEANPAMKKKEVGSG